VTFLCSNASIVNAPTLTTTDLDLSARSRSSMPRTRTRAATVGPTPCSPISFAVGSNRPQADCAELFRRMSFNAAITNNDDHPRNHALLRHSDGWRLSPVYDVVPVPMVSLERRDLALTVGSFGRTASLYNLISQSGRFGLSKEEARSEVHQIATTVGTWRERFAANGVSEKDIEYIAPAMPPPSFLSEEPPEPTT